MNKYLRIFLIVAAIGAFVWGVSIIDSANRIQPKRPGIINRGVQPRIEFTIDKSVLRESNDWDSVRSY